jgi:hypothetical protein
MPIKLNCPHCKKALSVKDHLAGRKAQCPACKQALTIPAPVSHPVNVEEFAAAALAQDAAAAAPAPAPKSIEFNCYYCDEKVTVSAELAGKQTPCPECKRIIKVPLLEKNEPKDWRKVDARSPAGARRDLQPAPEGTWDARAIGTVSREALLEAQALPQAKPRLTWQQKSKRAVVAVAALGLAGLVLSFAMSFLAKSRQEQAVAKAMQYLQAKDKLDAETVAELHRACGEYALRANKLVQEAQTHFQESRAALVQGEAVGTSERDLALADLALSQVELGGEKPDIEKGIRLRWEDAHKEIRQTLQNLRSLEVRTEAIRQVTRKLLSKGQGKLAASLATLFAEDASELLAVVGLEMVRAKDEQEAERLAEQAQPTLPNVPPMPSGTAKSPSPAPAPSLVALWLTLGKPDRARSLAAPPEEAKEASLPWLIGHAEGFARQGNIDQARANLRDASPPERLAILLAISTAVVDQGRLEAARPLLEEALTLVEGESKGKRISPWWLYRLARLSAEVGLVDGSKAAARVIPDPVLRGRAQLELLRFRLAAKETVDDSYLQMVDKDTPAAGLAAEAFARQKARQGAGTDLLKTVDGWEPERSRPLGFIGVALGLQDRGL